MEKSKLAGLSALMAVLFGGCALDSSSLQYSNTTAIPQTAYSQIQNEEMKKATAKLIQKITEFEARQSGLESTIGNLSGKLKASEAELDRVKNEHTTNVGLSPAMMEEIGRLNQKITELEGNITAIPKVIKVGEIDYTQKMAVVSQKFGKLVSAPSKDADVFERPKMGEAYEIEKPQNGFFYIPKQKAYIHASFVKLVDKELFKKSQKKEQKPSDIRQQQATVQTSQAPTQAQTGGFFADSNTKRQQPQSNPQIEGKPYSNNAFDNNAKIANADFIEKGRIAKQVGFTLSKQLTVNDSNVNERCRMELGKQGIDGVKTPALIDTCAAFYQISKK